MGPADAARFWVKVDESAEGGCWLWIAGLQRGYGQFSVDGRPVRAHRITYQLFKGPIPDGLVLDHLCRRKNCVNPDHLEAVTNRVNSLRGISPAIQIYHSGMCGKGHPRTPENVYVEPNGHRQCRPCKQETNRQWYLRKKAQRTA